MTRYHQPRIELVHEGVGDVFDSVFGAFGDDTKAYDDQIRAQLKPFLKELGIYLDELHLAGVRFAISCFILQMRALPPRPKSQLAGTLGKIARNPKRFLERSEAYEPEAVALLLDACAEHSESNKKQLIAWELAQGPGPAIAEIVAAARRAREVLEAQIKAGQKRGRPAQVPVTELAIRLSRLFIGAGGSLARNTRRKQGDETGAFHRFLEIVLEPIMAIGWHLQGPLDVRTMARKAIAAQKKQAQPVQAKICPGQDSPPLNTAP